MLDNSVSLTPPTMCYWETITVIAKQNKINLKQAIIKYHNLTNIPQNSQYETLLKLDEKYLFPYGCKIKITTDEKTLGDAGILDYSNKEARIEGIDIEFYEDEERLNKEPCKCQ